MLFYCYQSQYYFIMLKQRKSLPQSGFQYRVLSRKTICRLLSRQTPHSVFHPDSRHLIKVVRERYIPTHTLFALVCALTSRIARTKNEKKDSWGMYLSLTTIKKILYLPKSPKYPKSPKSPISPISP